ncbi:MAG: anthranilate synthase component II [Planctomycetota bacterium]
MSFEHAEVAGEMRLLIIDNYDSFTYNLAQALESLGAWVRVVRNDALGLDDLEELRFAGLVISPGPGGPRGSGISRAAFLRFRRHIPFLGVCLGHQVMAEAMGGTVGPALRPVHGKKDWIEHRDCGIFEGLPQPFPAARYHSLTVKREALPSRLRVMAWSRAGEIMALGIPGEASWGVQFHPESYMTAGGDRLLAAFLEGRICPREEGVFHEE